MNITDITIYRDGGSITFRVAEDAALDGNYCLETPFMGEPRPMFRDGERLAFGSAAEVELSAKLQRWLDAQLTPEASDAIRELDELPQWRNLPDRLSAATPLYHIRTVIRCLQDRLLNGRVDP